MVCFLSLPNITCWPRDTFSALCATLSAGLLFLLTYQENQHRSMKIRYLFGALFGVLLLTNPLVNLTSGRAWNHDLPTLLIFIVFLLFRQGFQKANSKVWFFVGGIFLGLAIGTRLTYIFVTIPLLGMIYLFPGEASIPHRLKLILYFTMGLGLALLPALYLLLLAPEGFYFGNYVYPRLHTVYQSLQRLPSGTTVGGKIPHFVSNVLTDPLNLILYGGYLYLFLRFARSKKSDKLANFYFVFTGALVVALLLGAFAPTPALVHYYFAPMPFLVMALMIGVARFTKPDRTTLGVLVLVAIFSVIWHISANDDLEKIPRC